MSFWLAASALLVAALGFVLAPALIRQQATRRLPLTNLIAAVVLVPFALGLYLHVTTWSDDPQANTALPPVTDMVQRLAERLATNPNDADGWRLLGQSYVALGRYQEARDALRQAWERTPIPDDALRVALGEAEALTDRNSLGGEAGALFTEVLNHDPANQKALWYGGLAALMTQQPELARDRWSRLLALDPPDSIAQVLREQIQALGGTVETAAAPSPSSAPSGGASGGVRLLVRMSEALESTNVAAASLFIFARGASAGPPVAVLRRSAGELPGEFRLTDADAMIPGRSLSDFESLTIIARISLSGQPTEQPGDLFGQISYRPGQDLDVQELVIDQVAP